MEVCPVKEAKPSKYPRMDEVSPESIKEAVPRRWSENCAATAVFAALTVPAIAGYAPEDATNETACFIADIGNAEITINGRNLAAAANGTTVQKSALLEAYIDVGMPEPPIIPYCIAVGAAIGIGLWINHIVEKRKASRGGEEKSQPADSKDEHKYDGGEY